MGKKRQKDLKRRFGQGQRQDDRARQLEALQARVGQELGDPQRFAHHLQRFAQLALVTPGLHAFRYPPGAFVDALLEVELSGQGEEVEQAKECRQALIPKVASPDVIPRLEQALLQAQGNIEGEDDLLALMAGRALVFAAKEEPGALHHPLWSILCDLSLSEAALSGHFLIRLVRDGLELDAGAVAKTFARAVNDPEVGRELDAMGLDEPDPEALAGSYLDLVAEEEPYHLQFDAVLNLAAAHVDMTGREGAVLTRLGPTAAVKAAFLERYEDAYAKDVTQTLVDELALWFGERAKRVNADPSVLPDDMTPEQVQYEQRRSLVAWLAARAIPIEESAFLRSVHVMSLLLSRTLVDPGEAPFVHRLWPEPTDGFGLEEYERFLLEKGEPNRAKRVRAFQPEARRLRQEAAAATQDAAAEAVRKAAGDAAARDAGGEAPEGGGEGSQG